MTGEEEAIRIFGSLNNITIFNNIQEFENYLIDKIKTVKTKQQLKDLIKNKDCEVSFMYKEDIDDEAEFMIKKVGHDYVKLYNKVYTLNDGRIAMKD